VTGARRIAIVGAGIAGLSAALAAKEAGAEVVVLERAPRRERGGNTRFSNGAIRAVRGGERPLSREQFMDDMLKVTRGRTDPTLAGILVDASADTVQWLAEKYEAVPGNTAWNRGSALSDSLFAAADRCGIEVLYGTRALSLAREQGTVRGVVAATVGGERLIPAEAAVLAAGGFEANPEWRARYLGAGWDLVKVRGSRFNTGDGLRIALEAGAAPYGHWSGCHSTGWDVSAPDQNTLELNTVFKRDSFNYGIVVNARGERFFDEGEDYGGLIYARLGPLIMAQPGGIVWQIYDARRAPLLLPEYHAAASTRITADNLDGLASAIEGIDRKRLLATIDEFNASVTRDIPFSPHEKDGRHTDGLAIPKSNWATEISEPPFEAYPCTTGVTFTFGGVRIDAAARVLDAGGSIIRGLYAAGEMVGGLFYYNYPGGAGLTSAAVFGRIAGRSAASD
jgi:tricarballylate dehydrogenase